MIYTTFYLRILRLSISNTNLLETYSSLLCRSETMGEVLRIKNISMRQCLRESIKMELRECIDSSSFANKKSQLDQASISCLLSLVKIDTFLQDLFSINCSEWDRCLNCEIENVSHYYNLLYTEDLPHNITELLLEQKNKIENYLSEDL